MNGSTNRRRELTFRQRIGKQGRGWLIGIVGLAVLSVLLFGAFGRSRQPELEAKSMPVNVMVLNKVETAEIDQWVTGLVRARRESQLAFERSAKVESVLVAEGDVVSRNQPLAILDTRDLKLREKQLSARLENAFAFYSELLAGPRFETILAAQAEVRALKAELQLAEQTRGRRESLRQSGAISDEEWQRAESVFNATASRLEASQKKLDELVAGTRDEKVWAQAAIVKQFEAELGQVKLDIEKSTLRAPFSGGIDQRMVDEGDVVASGDPVFRLVESEALEVVAGFSPAMLSQLKKGSCVDALVDGNEIRLKVARQLPAANRQTRTVPVIFEFQDPGARPFVIRPAQIVRIRTRERIAVDGFWVPTVALTPATRGLWSVYVVSPVKEGKSKVDNDSDQNRLQVKPRLVEVRLTAGEFSLISGPLDSGEKIVANGVHKVTGDQKVSIARRVPNVMTPE